MLTITGGAGVNLGTVDLGDTGTCYLARNSTQTETGTMTLSTVGGDSVVTIALTSTNANFTAVNATTTLVWTPSNGAQNLDGTGSSVSQVTQAHPGTNF